MRKLVLLFTALLPATLLYSMEARPSLTPEDRQAWIICLKRVKMKPPCCGACRIITDAELKTLWNYLTLASVSEDGRIAWEAHKDKLLEEFKQRYPDRFKALYDIQQKHGGSK